MKFKDIMGSYEFKEIEESCYRLMQEEFNIEVYRLPKGYIIRHEEWSRGEEAKVEYIKCANLKALNIALVGIIKEF